MTADGSEVIATIERWVAFGGHWTATTQSSERASVALTRCDGGEVVEEFVVTDEQALRWLAQQEWSSAGASSELSAVRQDSAR